jgi:hypothetical protein
MHAASVISHLPTPLLPPWARFLTHQKRASIFRRLSVLHWTFSCHLLFHSQSTILSRRLLPSLRTVVTVLCFSTISTLSEHLTPLPSPASRTFPFVTAGSLFGFVHSNQGEHPNTTQASPRFTVLAVLVNQSHQSHPLTNNQLFFLRLPIFSIYKIHCCQRRKASPVLKVLSVLFTNPEVGAFHLECTSGAYFRDMRHLDFHHA